MSLINTDQLSLDCKCPIAVLKGAIADEFGAQILYAKIGKWLEDTGADEEHINKIYEIMNEEVEHAAELMKIVNELTADEEDDITEDASDLQEEIEDNKEEPNEKDSD